jgi:branched-subunit amino acid ABC-type transport system permease component
MHQFWLAVGFGLVTASVIAVAAVGLSLQFGITNYINFAYGDFMALGAYLAWELNAGFVHWNIWVAMIAGSLLVGVFAVVVNQFIFAPFARRFERIFYVLIVTFALSLIILSLVTSIWGADVKRFNMTVQNPLHIGPFLLSVDQLIVVGIGLALMLAIHLVLTLTRLGKSMRAMSDSTTLAMTSGIDTRMITTITWFLTGIMAGLAGVVLGITSASITPSFGETFLFVIFAAVIVGGVGSVYGAILGAAVIGFVTEISAVFINPSYKLDTAFVVLILVLLFRPSGIFARVGKA